MNTTKKTKKIALAIAQWTLIEEQINEVKRKKKEEYYRYKKCVNNDAGGKNEPTDKGHWLLITEH